ncbi:hypothetical protein TL16_g11273 [Triparma laevis f. inornata]|uniref:Exocyst complex component Sec8 n=1 Tax=Triparma laevis f. inornata TaxID=1714386 RepID=A0A9W7ET04_9STRA|nr:hypothetical protein TL16_g11273 [Triparma laevis f. inornata]
MESPSPPSDLSSIENQLNTISSEFFEPDPRKFKTLHHVINVLAASEDQDDLQNNDAYIKLKRQHKIVQDGIEVVTEKHYRELNAGVVGLGKVSRQFNDALLKVQRLRRQVKAVQKALVTDLNRENPGSSLNNSQQNSLRELYDKKKECNAVLLILEKLSMLREAPRRYDTLIQSHRLHAALSHLSTSLTMLFSEDVASVQALSKVGEDLMMRKGGAEDLCTDALCDLIFLRTGSLTRNQEKAKLRPRSKTRASKHRRGNSYHRHRTPSSNVSDSDSDSASNASSSDESSAASFMGGSVSLSSNFTTRMNNSAPPLPHDKLLTQYTGRMLPMTFLSSSVSDADEMEVIGGGVKLEYSSTILPTKIIVRSMGMIGRVDDIIRNVMARAENEITSVERQTRLRTLSAIEDSQRPDAPKDLGLHYVRSHLFKLLNNYMDVTRRMGYCLQCILREKQGISEKDQQKINKNILVIVELMQSEIKVFLVCVLGEEVDDSVNESMERRSLLHRQTVSSPAEKKSIFSLNINTDPNKNNPNNTSKDSPIKSRRTRRRSSVGASTSATLVTSMSASQFVSTVLFPSSTPSVRHALPLRKYVARWCDGLALAVKELFPEGAQDIDQGAKEYLDSVIEERLLPLLQSDTVDSVVTSLESPVAFRSPVIGTSLSTTNLLPAVTHACSTLLDKTEPLFEALHRLPVEGEIFTAVLAVLEHVILTFASR